MDVVKSPFSDGNYDDISSLRYAKPQEKKPIVVVQPEAVKEETVVTETVVQKRSTVEEATTQTTETEEISEKSATVEETSSDRSGLWWGVGAAAVGLVAVGATGAAITIARRRKNSPLQIQTEGFMADENWEEKREVVEEGADRPLRFEQDLD